MLEIVRRGARALPLARCAEASHGGVAIRPSGAETRFSLRLRDGAALEVHGLRLDAPINSVATRGNVRLARLGPDEWLVAAPQGELDPGAIADGLRGQHHALVDVSHRSTGIDVAGRQAAVLLNAGCPLDLGEAAFPAGSATRTLLGKAEIVLLRPDAEPRYRVECWRSFATYLHGFLVEAAFGLGGVGAR